MTESQTQTESLPDKPAENGEAPKLPAGVSPEFFGTLVGTATTEANQHNQLADGALHSECSQAFRSRGEASTRRRAREARQVIRCLYSVDGRRRLKYSDSQGKPLSYYFR